MDYEILDNITSADIALSVKGESLSDIFIQAGNALVAEMTDYPGRIRDIESRCSIVSNPDLELLLFNFLNEILFYKDSEGLILKPVHIKIEFKGTEYLCSYELCGEKIKKSKCGFRVDIKGVALHRLEIIRSGDSYSAVIVFDV